MLCEYGEGEINFDPNILRLQMGGTHFGIYIMSLILDMLSLRTLGDIQVELLSRQLGMIIIITNNKSPQNLPYQDCLFKYQPLCQVLYVNISGHYKQSLQKDMEHHPHFINREIYSGRRHSGNYRTDLFSEDLGKLFTIKKQFQAHQ